MGGQARAAATRQRIIEAGVALFTELGYAETGLKDIVERAKVTTGAFYHHFASKEDLAWAVMDQGWPKAAAIIEETLGSANPGLEKVIVMTFAISNLLKQDRTVWVANHLNQGFGQLNERGRREFRDHAEVFVTRVADAIAPDDLRPEMTPLEVGNLVWIVLHGCHLLSDAMMDDAIERLRHSWEALLPAMVPAASLDYFRTFVARAATQRSVMTG